MKKASLFFVAVFTVSLAGCGNKTAQNVEKVDSEATQTSVVDSTFQKVAAGNYLSYDSQRVITLQKDGKVIAKGFDNEYVSWELVDKPENGIAQVTLNRKGLDNIVKEPGVIDLKEGKITVKDEIYRKAKSRK